MEVVSIRVSKEDLAQMKERANAEYGGQVSDLVRAAIREYLTPKPKHSLWRRTPKDSGYPVEPKDCLHPPSLVMQGSAGVYCDQCGSSL